MYMSVSFVLLQESKMLMRIISYPEETLRGAQYFERDPQSWPVGMVEALDTLRGMGDV